MVSTETERHHTASTHARASDTSTRCKSFRQKQERKRSPSRTVVPAYARRIGRKRTELTLRRQAAAELSARASRDPPRPDPQRNGSARHPPHRGKPATRQRDFLRVRGTNRDRAGRNSGAKRSTRRPPDSIDPLGRKYRIAAHGKSRASIATFAVIDALIHSSATGAPSTSPSASRKRHGREIELFAIARDKPEQLERELAGKQM